MKNSLRNLIEALYQVAQHYGDDIPVSVNLIGDRVLALKSVCLDDSFGQELQLFFEADLTDRAEQNAEFYVYSTTGNFNVLLPDEVNKGISKTDITSFLWDIDKMYDLLTLSKEEFLESYLYLTEAEYDLTLSLIKPVSKELEANEDQICTLGDLLREAENLYIEELNERPTAWNVLGSQLKEAIYDFVQNNLTPEQQTMFEGYCSNMGV